MNSNRRVLVFVVCSTSMLLVASVLAGVFHVKWATFNRVNLISDIISNHPARGPGRALEETPPPVIASRPHEDFSLYRKGRFITNFGVDTGKSSLSRFMQKLFELKSGKKRKIRIAYFGDSMIEGDLMTQTIRRLLQQYFGGSGVGFVPITSQVSKFRQTVIDNYSDGWQDENFKEGNNGHLYFSGHLFRSDNGWVQMKDQTISGGGDTIEKSLLCGYYPGPVQLVAGGAPLTIDPRKPLNRIVLDRSTGTALKVSVSNEKLPVYGLSFESSSGVILDNFSFRGITGIEFAGIDSSFLEAIEQENPYDLIVLQYGVNMLFRPNDKNFSWYARAMRPVIRKLRNCFHETDFLLVSTADRAFRYNGQYSTAIGIDSLIKIQALLAFENECSFYNQYESMGGRNSIVDWAGRTPALANKDYVHPNHRGAEILGNYFFEALLDDYEKFTRTLK